jgi:hypothetical protein
MILLVEFNKNKLNYLVIILAIIFYGSELEFEIKKYICLRLS